MQICCQIRDEIKGKKLTKDAIDQSGASKQYTMTGFL